MDNSFIPNLAINNVDLEDDFSMGRMLAESPDFIVNSKGVKKSFGDSNAYAFFVVNGFVFFGKRHNHPAMIRDILFWYKHNSDDFQQLKKQLSEDMTIDPRLDIKSLKTLLEKVLKRLNLDLSTWDNSSSPPNLYNLNAKYIRPIFDLAGRAWKDEQVISLWSEKSKVHRADIDVVFHALGIGDSDRSAWKIQFLDVENDYDKYIPYPQAFGSDKGLSLKKLSDEERQKLLARLHVVPDAQLTPQERLVKKMRGKGFGSQKKRVAGLSPTQLQQLKTTSESQRSIRSLACESPQITKSPSEKVFYTQKYRKSYPFIFCDDAVAYSKKARGHGELIRDAMDILKKAKEEGQDKSEIQAQLKKSKIVLDASDKQWEELMENPFRGFTKVFMQAERFRVEGRVYKLPQEHIVTFWDYRVDKEDVEKAMRIFNLDREKVYVDLGLREKELSEKELPRLQSLKFGQVKEAIFQESKKGLTGLGYKIVGFDGKRHFSIFDNRHTISSKIGSVEQNTHLGNSKKYVLDYFSVGENEKLFVYEYAFSDVTKGDPDFQNGEIVVKKAKLIKVEDISKYDDYQNGLSTEIPESHHYLLEYTKEQIWLAKYLDSNEVDPYQWEQFIPDWVDDEWDDEDEFVDKYGDASVSYDELDEEDKKRFKDWLEGEVDHLANLHPEMGQPNRAMDFIRYVKPNEWLIHFSDDAYDIAWKGFKYGSDLEMLHITTWKGERFRKDTFGTWAFAYLAGSRDSRGGHKKYGKQAVLFRSNAAILVLHYGDEERQVIFDRNQVTDRVYLENVSDGYEWAVISNKKGNVLFQGPMDKVITWVEKNYSQYKKAIAQGTK